MLTTGLIEPEQDDLYTNARHDETTTRAQSK